MVQGGPHCSAWVTRNGDMFCFGPVPMPGCLGGGSEWERWAGRENQRRALENAFPGRLTAVLPVLFAAILGKLMGVSGGNPSPT